jgi:hypothetical protein
MDFTVESLHAMEKKLRSAISPILKETKSTSASEIGITALMKLNKNMLAEFLVSLVKNYEDSLENCKSAAGAIDVLKTTQIKNQQSIMDLQQSKLSSVHETMKHEVEHEVKSWADIVQKNCNLDRGKRLTAKSVKEAVKSAVDEEVRSKNFIIYGLEEKSEGEYEDLTIEAAKIFEKAEQQEPFPEALDAYRLGVKSPGKIRPVKVTMRYSDEVKHLLNSANKLRKDDGVYKNVYLSPDRSKEERAVHKKLVLEMKELITKNPNKHYFIRGNEIKCTDKKS